MWKTVAASISVTGKGIVFHGVIFQRGGSRGSRRKHKFHNGIVSHEEETFCDSWLRTLRRGGSYAADLTENRENYISHLYSKLLMFSTERCLVLERHFCRSMLCKRCLCRHAVSARPSVCLFVRHVRVFCRNG